LDRPARAGFLMEIRSYRRVFDLERRIYRVDRLRLNPGGVPVRGIVYFLAILAVLLVVGHLPVLGALARALPWYLSDLALPAASAATLTVIRIEGRPFHQAAHALVRRRGDSHWLAGAEGGRWSRRVVAGGRWHMGEITMLPDGSDGRLRRLRYTGPGAVLVTVAHERRGKRWGSPMDLVLRPRTGGAGGAGGAGGTDGEGRVIALAVGARLSVRTTPPPVSRRSARADDRPESDPGPVGVSR
jgi:hypothetical protein